ncbi:hypothetical protein B296_00046634 [Ensete ventricosum]|uniref:Uncharacterized protein n=1 Tax=Ensete ventricosum TaxID=4639 RepID=A0A426XW08_ENSVE|nr:hypothetical protein B296_00046634 [Ensete ventricosum]
MNSDQLSFLFVCEAEESTVPVFMFEVSLSAAGISEALPGLLSCLSFFCPKGWCGGEPKIGFFALFHFKSPRKGKIMRAQASTEDQVWREKNQEKEGSLMSFGGLSDGRSGGALAYGNAAMTAGELSPPQLISQRLPNSAFICPRLSLGLIDMSRMAGVAGGSDAGSAKRSRDDENESRSESDNLEAISGDDVDQENPRKKKRHHRHTPQQIQELES